jgi:trans-aconitate 2-methyltransferase
MSDWDAARYHRVSDPQLAWGRTVAARLAPSPGERVLDIGCGTGRLTEEIAATPGLVVIGVDASAAMLSEAAGHLRRGQTPPPGADRGQTPERDLSRDFAATAGTAAPQEPAAALKRGQTPALDSYRSASYVRADGAALPFTGVFDAVFSAATFHWIPDHERLFRSIHVALKPGGRLVAQCGGAGNLQRLYARARNLMAEPRFSRYFAAWTDPWYFENVAETESRLERAGFSSIEVGLIPSPVTFDGSATFADFISCVCVRHHVDRLPPAERASFVDELCDRAAADDPPYTLDYWRLNISARKARS